MHPKCPQTVWDEHNQKNKIIGPHSLMNLGFFAGVHKSSFGSDSSWDTFSEEMLEYCAQDVRTNIAVYNMLLKETLGFTDYCVQLEMDVARYIAQQELNGWVFDVKRARMLECDLALKVRELEEQVTKTFKPLPKFDKEVQPRIKADGSLSSVGLKFLEDYETLIPVPDSIDGPLGIEYTSGAFSRIDWPEFNLGSRQQIAEQLLYRGWKPTEFTEKGSIIINEAVLADLEYPEAKLLSDYFLVSKKQSMVESWIESWNEDDGRIHGYVNSLGAATRRMTHSKPNLAQVPAAKSNKEGLIWGFEGGYGADCRALFTVPAGYTLVGCDASGLELRMLAHYMNDPAYTDLILNGDIHTANQLAAGLATRNQAKTFIYAFLYGAGDEKIGSIVGGSAKEGKKLKKAFLDNTPALKNLREQVLLAAERGWIRSIDGGKIRIKSAHAALNYLLQSAGAILMKVALRSLISDALAEGLDFKMVGNIHDEFQAEVKDEHVARYKELCENCFIKAGEELGFRIKIQGEAKSGKNWAETH